MNRKKPPGEKFVGTTIHLHPKQLEALEELKDETGVSMGYLIRMALNKFLMDEGKLHENQERR